MTPAINSVPPSRVTVYQSVNPSLPLSIHHADRCQTEAVRGTSSISTPLLGRTKGRWQLTRGQGEFTQTHTHPPSHTHMHAYSVPTRLLVGFGMSCICILGSRRMHMQMKTMLIVIKGHLLLHVSPFSLSLRLPSLHLFIFRFLSVFFSCCLSQSTFPILYTLSLCLACLKQPNSWLLCNYRPV